MPAPSIPLTRLAPAEPDPGRNRAWTVAGSVLLHLAVFALLLSIAARRPPADSPAPSYDLVFEENGSPSPQPPAGSLPPAQSADMPVPEDALPGSPAPPPTSPPSPDGVPSPLPESADAAPAPAATQTTSLEPASSAPPVLAFAPPIPEPATAAPPPVSVEVVPAPGPPPAVRLQVPREEKAPSEQDAIMPVPPPLPPQRQAQAQPPRPRPQPRAAPGTLASPMDLSFSPAAPRPAPAARGSVASRAIDLSPGPPREGPDRSDPYFQFHAANASADWNRALLAYWLRHRYYPRQAQENGDEGTVVLEMTVSRSGRVEAVEVTSRSGSAWLDMAALGTFRSAQLPPLPATEGQDRITFPITVTYVLIRH